MTVGDWLANVSAYYDRYPAWNATRATLLTAWMGVARRAGSHSPAFGESVWDRDWDVLVLLDACRPDALEAVSSEYDFLPAEVPTMTSRASWSRAWCYETFAPQYRDEVAKTAYVTGNVFSREFGSDATQIADPDWFAGLDEVWRDGWDADHGTVPPRQITDRAIATWRAEDTDADRMILHYMQPHAPYRSLDINGHESPDRAGQDHRRTVWDELQAGVLSAETACAAYRDNLRWVLDDLSLLLENIDAETVALSADHAELFGEYGLYSHPDVPVPRLRQVPWIETTAVDNETYTHTETGDGVDSAVTESEVEERLAALGYA